MHCRPELRRVPAAKAELQSRLCVLKVSIFSCSRDPYVNSGYGERTT